MMAISRPSKSSPQGPAGTQVRGDTTEAALGRLSAIRAHDVDVDVQDFHRPLAPDIPRISPQELIESLPPGHGLPPSASR
jgi:hypothetical protein